MTTAKRTWPTEYHITVGYDDGSTQIVGMETSKARARAKAGSYAWWEPRTDPRRGRVAVVVVKEDALHGRVVCEVRF